MGKGKSGLKKIPWWKRILSYLDEVHLETTSSHHNPQLTLCIDKGRIQLYTEKAIYSYEDLYDNFYKLFEKIDFSKKQFNNILILGFGLGSIPYMLENNFGVKAKYTGIEIDEEILRLASDYTLPKLQSPYTLITADAYAYAAQSQDQFDMIAIDVFVDDTIPAKFEESQFLENAEKMLAKDGLLLMNRLTTTDSDKEKYQSFLEETFSPIFTEAIGITVDDNTILLNHSAYLKT